MYHHTLRQLLPSLTSAALVLGAASAAHGQGAPGDMPPDEVAPQPTQVGEGDDQNQAAPAEPDPETFEEPRTGDSEVVRPVHPGDTEVTTEGEEETDGDQYFFIPLPLRTPGALGDGYVQQPPEELPGEWSFSFGGYVRVGYRYITNDPALGVVGRNDGFILANARPLVVGKYGRSFGFRIQLEGASEIGSGTTNPGRELVARLRDAFLFYSPHPALELQAGRFRAPFELEALFSTGDMMFPTRSVVSEGVSDFEGRELTGLSVDREVGVMLTASTPIFPLADDIAKPEGPGVSYALAVTNGSSADISLNDNDQLSYYGRLGLHWSDLVRLGGAAYYNDQTLGDPPDQVGEALLGMTGDLSLAVAGFTLAASYTQVEVTAEVEAEPVRTSQGYQVQMGWQDPWIGLQPAVRWASYSPYADYPGRATKPDPAFEGRELNHLSVGLNFNPPGLPIRSLLTYTLTLEQETRELNNDRLDLLLQVSW